MGHRQYIEVRKVLYKIRGEYDTQVYADYVTWSKYERQTGELEEYLLEVDKKITAISKGVYEDAPDKAGKDNQQESEQDAEMAKEGPKKRPRKKKRKPKTARTSQAA